MSHILLNKTQKLVLKLRKQFDNDLNLASDLFSFNDVYITSSLLAALLLAESQGNKNHREFDPGLYEELSNQNPISYSPDVILASWNHGASNLPGYLSKDFHSLGPKCGKIPFTISAFYNRPATILASYLFQVADLSEFIKLGDIDTVIRIFKFKSRSANNNLANEYLDTVKAYMLFFEESLKAIPDIKEYLALNKELDI